MAGEFCGVWTALVTPFRGHGEIDWGAFEQLLELQKIGRVDGVVISGTTGEAPTLTVQEKLSLVRKARAVLGKATRVMAGTGDNNTQQTIELSKLAQDAGADSLLVVTPPYNKPSFAGLQNHYRTVAAAVRIPLCIYHVPSRTAHLLPPDNLAALCQIPGIGCVKEATGDIAYFSRALSRSRVPYLSGDDPSFLGSLAIGGSGVISVVSNIFPGIVKDLTEAFDRGDVRRARRLHDALMPTIDALFCETNPCPLKAALKILGHCEDTVRAPLATITDASLTKVHEALTRTKELLE